MICTSAEANKMLRKLNDEWMQTISHERDVRTFNAALNEDPESVRPAYDFSETQDKLDLLEDKIRRLKHSINLFNTTHTVPGFSMTVDEMLVYIPQLNKRKAKLAEMKGMLPKSRVEVYARGSNIIDYQYANFDLHAAAEAYEQVTDELNRAQLALDQLNTGVPFDFDI